MAGQEEGAMVARGERGLPMTQCSQEVPNGGPSGYRSGSKSTPLGVLKVKVRDCETGIHSSALCSLKKRLPCVTWCKVLH